MTIRQSSINIINVSNCVIFFVMEKNDPKLAMIRLYLMSRRILKFCKHLDSDKIITNLIILSLKESPKTIRELSTLFDVKHSWMSAKIGKIEDDGIIVKAKMKDPRYKLVKLTPKGLKIEKGVETYMDRHCMQAFSELKPKEIQQIGEWALKVRTDYGVE